MANTWIQHVKEYAAKHGVAYTVALKQAGASYKKIDKESKQPSPPKKPLVRSKAPRKKKEPVESVEEPVSSE